MLNVFVGRKERWHQALSPPDRKRGGNWEFGFLVASSFLRDGLVYVHMAYAGLKLTILMLHVGFKACTTISAS